MNPNPTRQQFSLLVIALAYLLVLQVGHLPIWTILSSAGFGLWWLLISLKKVKQPTIILIAPITIGIGIGILITFNGLISRDAGVAMLVVMLALKLLEANTKRDYMLMVLLGYFVVGTLFLFDQSIIAFISSIPALILLTASLIQVNRQPTANKSHSLALALAAKMLVQSIPLMLLLFVLFPRISHPLWGGIIKQNKINTSGLSESIELNQISQTAKDGSVAFRVKFKDEIPKKEALYWRGPVLWKADKNNWKVANSHQRLPYESVSVGGSPIEYTMTMEPNNHHWLLMLDMPVKIPSIAHLTHDYSALATKATQTRVRYNATSYIDYRLGAEPLNKRARKMGLQLNSHNPKTIALGRQWAHLSPTEIIRNALAIYQNNAFIYTLNPPNYGNDALDDFLFQSKRGFCEHYATSFVYLMRAAGVPARVIGGYQGGEINDDYLIVRQSDAHAWAEVWLEGQGWIRIDPTQAVSPQRIEQGIVAAMQQANTIRNNATADTLTDEVKHLPFQNKAKEYPILHRSILGWDKAEHRWNQWIIDYDQQQQQALLGGFIGKKPNLSIIGSLFIVALLISIGVASLLLWRKNKPQLNQTQKLYSIYLHKLNSFGLKPDAHETALGFANRAALILPHHQSELIKIAEMYNLLSYSRYNRTPDNTLMSTFKKMIAQFKPKHVK